MDKEIFNFDTWQSKSANRFDGGSKNDMLSKCKRLEEKGCPHKEECCAVCLTTGEDTILFPCQHQFHGDCILQWVEMNWSCPLCRQRIDQFIPLKDEPAVHSRFQEAWERHFMSKDDTPEPPTGGPLGGAKTLAFEQTQTTTQPEENADEPTADIVIVEEKGPAEAPAEGEEIKSPEEVEPLLEEPDQQVQPGEGPEVETNLTEPDEEPIALEFEELPSDQPLELVEEAVEGPHQEEPVDLFFQNEEVTSSRREGEASHSESEPREPSVDLEVMEHLEPADAEPSLEEPQRLDEPEIVIMVPPNEGEFEEILVQCAIARSLAEEEELLDAPAAPKPRIRRRSSTTRSPVALQGASLHIESILPHLSDALERCFDNVCEYIPTVTVTWGNNRRSRRRADIERDQLDEKDDVEERSFLYETHQNIQAGAVAGGMTAAFSVLRTNPAAYYPVFREIAPNVAIFFTSYEFLKSKALSSDDTNMKKFGKRTVCAGMAAAMGHLPQQASTQCGTIPLRFGLQFGVFEFLKDELCRLRSVPEEPFMHRHLSAVDIAASALGGGLVAASVVFPLEVALTQRNALSGTRASIASTIASQYKVTMTRMMPACVLTAMSFEFGRRVVHFMDPDEKH